MERVWEIFLWVPEVPIMPKKTKEEKAALKQQRALEKKQKMELARIYPVTEESAKAVNILKHKKRRWGDRSDGYKLRTINAMNKFMPYIMAKRSDGCNTYADSFDISKTEAYCRAKVKEGKKNFTILHVILAAYVRTVSQRPGINRFVSGQKIYARNKIEVVMTIKKRMAVDAEDTCIKVQFEPTDTIEDVYDKFNQVVMENTAHEEDKSSFDKVNKIFSLIPGLICRWTVKLLFFLDYFGLLPKKLLQVSPFHGSMIITSMGSLGIKPIYHHIYDFGNLPIFIAYGVKRYELVLDENGETHKKRFVDFKVVTDERICDGFYYASAFKVLVKYVENPELLEARPEQVLFDIE